MRKAAFASRPSLPAEYPGRTRHIHVKVQAPGGRILTTQLYFPGDPGNKRDCLYRPELENEERRSGRRGQGFDFVVQNCDPDPEFLTPAVVPGVAGVAVATVRPPRNSSFSRKAKILAIGVELRLAVAGAQRMAVQDDDLAAAPAREALQPAQEVDLLARRRAPR